MADASIPKPGEEKEATPCPSILQLEELLRAGRASCSRVDEVWPNLFIGDESGKTWQSLKSLPEEVARATELVASNLPQARNFLLTPKFQERFGDEFLTLGGARAFLVFGFWFFFFLEGCRGRV